MANVFADTGIHWGVGSSTSTAFGTFLLQDRDYARKANKSLIKDGFGITVGAVWNDPNEEATFTYLATSGTVTGSATATIPQIGDKLTVVDTIFTQIAGTSWYVDDASAKNTNNSMLMVTVKCSKYPGMA